MASDRGHINQALTQFVAGVSKNLDGYFIADQVAPPENVPNMSDAYWIMGDDELRDDGDIISTQGDVPRVNFTQSDTTYKCLEYGQETILSKAEMANADAAIRYQQRRASGLVTKVRLALEVRVAAWWSNASVITQTAALGATDKWDVDGSDPVGQALTAKETIRAATGMVPNSVIMGPHVHAHLAVHPAITSRFAMMAPGQPATDAQIAAALGVDNVYWGRAIYLSSIQGATKTRADVWGKMAAFAYIDPTAGEVEGTITPVKRFRYDGFMPEFGTYEYDEGALKRILGVYACYALQTIAAPSAYLYTTVVS
jgi:hypothetical protein